MCSHFMTVICTWVDHWVDQMVDDIGKAASAINDGVKAMHKMSGSYPTKFIQQFVEQTFIELVSGPALYNSA